MAECDAGLRASILGGSDVIFDFYCQPCNSENLHLEATSYCEQCQEYLCDNCCKNHRKYAALKNHKLLDKAAMPKTEIVPKARDVLLETCSKHVGKVFEYFCDTHDELCCSVCFNMDHKDCNISYVPDVSDGAASAQEYKELVTKMDDLVAAASKEQIKISFDKQNNDVDRTKAMTNIKAFRKDVDKEMVKAEKSSINAVSAHHQEKLDRIQSAEQNCKSAISAVKAIKTELDEKSKNDKKNQLYVDMKIARHRLTAIENDITCAKDLKTSRYVFDQEDNVQEMVSTLSAIWSLSVRQNSADTKARYLKEVAMKSETDTHDCNISGIAILPGDRIVVTDSANFAAKLVNVKLNTVTAQVSLSGKPFDVTQMEDDNVAVSLGGERKIEILTVDLSDVLISSRTIDIPGNVFQGLYYNDGTFILAFPLTRSIKIVDLSGRVLSIVYTDTDNDPLLKFPIYTTLNRTKDVIYVTDKDANAVVTMTMTGKVVAVCKHDMLKLARGVTVGRDGHVYVGSGRTNTVHQLSASGEHVKILLDQTTSLAPWPHALEFDQENDRLLISSASTSATSRNYVRIFQLE